MEIIAENLKWQPSWTPSWISQNAQGWPKSTRQILKEDTLNYQYQLKKKLYKKFLGSSILLPDYKLRRHLYDREVWKESYIDEIP